MNALGELLRSYLDGKSRYMRGFNKRICPLDCAVAHLPRPRDIFHRCIDRRGRDCIVECHQTAPTVVRWHWDEIEDDAEWCDWSVSVDLAEVRIFRHLSHRQTWSERVKSKNWNKCLSVRWFRSSEQVRCTHWCCAVLPDDRLDRTTNSFGRELSIGIQTLGTDHQLFGFS